jgi:hypothetical protein
MRHRHVDIGGENGDEQEAQSPARRVLNLTLRNEQSDTAQELENAADQDAGAMKRDPGRHDPQKRNGMKEVKHRRSQEKRGENKTNEEPENQE